MILTLCKPVHFNVSGWSMCGMTPLFFYSCVLICSDKPPVEELRYFLEFQMQQVWAPVPSSIRGHQRKEPVCPSLQFSLMGPKLYISSEQV